jgi:hypothetical protein
VRIRRGLVRAAALSVVVSLPLLGLSAAATASAKATSATCAKHPKKAGCLAGGKAGSNSNLAIQIDPNILPEVGPSEVDAVVQVEANPTYAGDLVTVFSSQLNGSCQSVSYETAGPQNGTTEIAVPLDNDGNAIVLVQGLVCAPGNDLFEADLSAPPFLTTTTVLRVFPPFVLVPGVYPNPSTSGSVTTGQVETGDTAPDESSVLNVFYVATDPVYAEQPVAIDSAQLDGRCQTAWIWFPANAAAPGAHDLKGAGPNTSGTEATAILDNDGNAVFVFAGSSCAAGSSVVVAEVEAGTHPTYANTYTIVAPTPTI